jgi:hypothetical protein
MKGTSVNKLRKLVALVLTVGVVVMGCLVSAGSAYASDSASANTVAAWQTAIGQLSSPGTGCFSASYPNLQWNATTCTTVPDRPMAPATQTSRGTPGAPMTVGNGHDYSAQVSGTIFQTTGSFANVSSGISEKGQINDSGPQLANTFTLQLNTQFFTTTACSAAKVPGNCQGWQQFVYETDNNAVYMQYWLIDYATTCPSGWATFGNDCFTNSPGATNSDSAVTAKGLADVKLEGSAFSGSNDAVTLVDGTTATSATNADTKLHLSQSWNTSEFGVFGDAGGGQANFASGSNLVAQTTLGSSSASAPACVLEGFTGETNNLNLAKSAAIGTQSSPTLTSKQSFATPASTSCATAAGAGLTGYDLVEAHTSVPADAQGLATAQCPSGDVVAGGGGYQSLQTTKQSLNSSWPNSNSSWSDYFNNASTTADTGTALAYCVAASSVGDYSRAVGTSVTVPTSSQVQSVVLCPSGTVSLGGGFFNDSTTNTYGAADSAPYGTSGWRTYLDAGPNGSTTGEAEAVCASQPAGWVQRNSPYATNPANTATNVSTSCPSGTEVLGGGSFISSSSPLVMIGLTTSLSSLGGWHTMENNNSSSSQSVDAWGICANT